MRSGVHQCEQYSKHTEYYNIRGTFKLESHFCDSVYTAQSTNEQQR